MFVAEGTHHLLPSYTCCDRGLGIAALVRAWEPLLLYIKQFPQQGCTR